MTVFTPPPADTDEPPEEATSTARPTARRVARADESDDFDDRGDRDRRRPRRRGSLTWLWFLFGGLGLMGCLCCGGFGLVFYASENPTFQPYSSPEGKFTAEFPGPTVPQRLALGEGKPMTGVESRREMYQETYFIYYVDLPKAPRDDKVDDVLQKAATDLIAAKGRPGQPTTKAPATHGGHPAVEVHVQVVPFEPSSGLVARVVLVGKRLYVIGVNGQVMPEQNRVEHFLQSFKITGADEKKDGN
jgi:hypothetical protein